MAGPSNPPRLVSAVVIGRNEGARLVRCLRSVFAMRQEQFSLEVIYVDSGSTDGSVATAKAEGARTIELRPERPSAALGRNAGWREAKGEIILFLDGDTVLHPDFVAESLPDFASPRVAVVWGHRRELYPGNSIYNRILDLDWIYAPGLTEYCGGDALFRRSILLQTSGFDPTLVAGEEPELCRRIRALDFDILHVDRPMTGHDLAITRFAQYWKRLTRAGHAFAEVADRFRDTDQPFWSEAVSANRTRFLILAITLCAATAAAVLARTLLPLIAYLLLLLLLSLRSARRSAWKSDDPRTLLLYGIHSHFQQLPVFWGQMQYKWRRWRGVRSVLFEYK